MSTQTREAVRIQLEGSLEIVEALVARWQAAASEFEVDSKLAGTGWYGLTEADGAGAHAVAELERRAVDHPLLSQLADARARVERALRQHTAAIGLALEGDDARALLNDLRTKHPIDTVQVSMLAPASRSLTRVAMAAAIGLAIFVSGLARWHTDWQHLLWATFVLTVLVVSSRQALRKPQPQVPRDQTVVVAGRSIRLPGHDRFEELTSVTWSLGATVQLKFTQHPEITINFSETPSDLVRVLREHSVPIVDGSP